MTADAATAFCLLLPARRKKVPGITRVHPMHLCVAPEGGGGKPANCGGCPGLHPGSEPGRAVHHRSLGVACRRTRQTVSDSLPTARVLLVDDNPINQLVAREMLLSLGVSVDTADHGVDALARLEGAHYALVFMDVMMPVLDGLAATRQWREREQTLGRRRLPVIALTANAMSGDRERCLEAGMDDYLSKPVRREQLAGVLARWLPPATRPGS